MRRRDFIKVVAGSASFRPLAAHAQRVERTRLIGVLMAWPESDTHAQSWLAVFRSALAKLGWMEGSNLRIDFAGAPPMRTGRGRSRKSWSICDRT